MNRLLRAEFARLKKDFFFWFTLAASFVCGGIFAAISIFEWGFDYDYTFMLFLATGGFVSMFVYRENSGGAVRNKVIVGHTRGDIFLSGLIVHIAVALILTLAFLLPVGALCFEWLKKAPAGVLLMFLGGMALTAVTCAVIFTVVMYLTPQKIVGALVCFILIMAAFIGTYQVEFYLYQPEYTTIDYELENGEMTDETVPNNMAVSGFGRVLLIAVDSLMPQGQANTWFSYLSIWAYPDSEMPDDYEETVNESLEDMLDELEETLYDVLPCVPVCSAGVSVLLSCIGWAVFRKKELK